MKDWLILFCIAIIAALAFRGRERWMPQKAAPVPAVILSETPPSARAAEVLPPDLAPVAPETAEKAELANLVAQSQRMATVKYPALGVANSEINLRFNFRYKRLSADHSARLQDPNWPVQLADECAKDAGIVPATTRPATMPPPAPTRPASPPTGTVQTASTSASSSRVPPPASAPAQTLVFHPATAPVPLTPPAPRAAVISTSKPSGALPFVTMDAVNQKSTNHYTYNWGYYDYGWYDMSFRQSVGIAINVRNMSRESAAVNLRWLFFARQSNNTRVVFGGSGKELDLAPGQSTDVTADSPTLQRREVNDAYVGQRYLSGSKYEGWLVQLVERGSNRVIKQTGSTGYLEDLAKRSDFTTLAEDYKKAGTGL